jgi:hypothetical protein
MPVVVSSEGYYQVDDYWDMQDVSQNSINYKMFRGWNERRLLLGLPIYKYEGSQMQEVGSLDDARIMPGANMQHTNLWRRIQEETFTAADIFINPDNTGYAIGLGNRIDEDGISVYDTHVSTTEEIDELFELQYRRTNGGAFDNGLIEHGDIIGPWVINDILKRMWYYRQSLLVPKGWVIFPTGEIIGSFNVPESIIPVFSGFYGFFAQFFYGAQEIETAPGGFFRCGINNGIVHSRIDYILPTQITYENGVALVANGENFLGSKTVDYVGEATNQPVNGSFNTENFFFVIGQDKKIINRLEPDRCGQVTVETITDVRLLFDPQFADLPPST